MLVSWGGCGMVTDDFLSVVPTNESNPRLCKSNSLEILKQLELQKQCLFTSFLRHAHDL